MSVRRGLALVAVGAAIAGMAMGVVYGLENALLTFALLCLYGGAVLGISHLFAIRRERLGPLARQFQVGVAVVVGLGLAGIAIVAALMFVSAHDALLMALLVIFTGALGVYSASLMARGAMRDIESVRDCLDRVGEGRRDVLCETGAADELSELAEAVNHMTARLAGTEAAHAAASAAHRDLIAAVSHDLRTPLASLQVLAEAIDDEVVDTDTRRRYVKQISTHVRSLAALVEDLFELSRLEAGEIQWSMQRVRLDELVEEAVEAMRPQADVKRVLVRADLPAALRPARADPERLQRVLFNLVQNAIRHTPADGSVTVAAEPRGEEIEVEVADSGEGVAASDRERIFEPFYRGGSDTSRGDGRAGLGLAICRAIVEAHGGKIWLADSSGGTRVRFSLPSAA